MFREHLTITYDAPADLKKWPSLNKQRVTGKQAFLVHSGTLADCIRELLAKPIKQISLYDIITEPQKAFDSGVLSPGDAAGIAMRQDFYVQRNTHHQQERKCLLLLLSHQNNPSLQAFVDSPKKNSKGAQRKGAKCECPARNKAARARNPSTSGSNCDLLRSK